MDCWKKAREFRIETANLIKTFPDYEKFALSSQMLRASRSVTNNIAEGYGRFYHKENIQFCRISRGSLYELLDDLEIALEEKYIDKTKYDNLSQLIVECVRILNGYINYLSKANEK
ncbi:MAG: four helix bundle protein [Flavobacteriaceae bacterium]